MKSAVAFLAAAAVLLAVLPVASLPTPGLNGTTTEAIPLVGRLFPEPLMTNDYIGYFEAIPSLEKLNQDYPDRIELLEVSTSAGWESAQSGQVEPQPVWTIEVTNERSTIPFDERIHLVFTCSIHGNEKGGREGCMRVVEDFAKEIGMVEANPDLIGLLDYMVLSFTIPNTDGWTHDEPEYFAANPNTMYTRGNSHGVDLNRQWPTMGFMEQDSNHLTMQEPEIAGVAPFLTSRYPNVWYAIDIHGMLTPADADTSPPAAEPTEFQEWLERGKGHFLLGLLPNAQLTQDEYVRITQMAELIRDRTSGCPGTLGPTWCEVPSTGTWGGAYNFWGTAWETIGYTSTGSTSNFMMSPTGLNAPSATYEMSYNHIVCDGIYPGCGAYMNEFHVNNVRAIVGALMEAAQKDLRVSLETGGARIAYLFNPKVVTTADGSGAPRAAGGWSDENPLDDGWDILHNVYHASANEYFRNLAGYTRDGDRPGVFVEAPVATVDAAYLADFDTFVVPSSTSSLLGADQVAALDAWVQAGGRLVLTDDSLELLARLGLVPADSVRLESAYVGFTDVIDYSHQMAANLQGYSRQTYDPTSIGYAQGAAPVWVVDTADVATLGTVVGVLGGGGSLTNSPDANFGEITYGAGRIRYLGALVPDPSIDLYTPYGVANYGVSYAGNQFLLNTLDLVQVFEAPPLVLTDAGQLRKVSGDEESSAPPTAGPEEAALPEGRSPGLGAVLALALLVGAAALARRARA